MRRTLLHGTTSVAEIGEFNEVRNEARKIAQALNPLGPSNIQLRVSNERPVCFEINIRFSGTTPIRAQFGFNDVEASIRHFLLGETDYVLPEITEGVALRYWNEAYIDLDAYGQLKKTGFLKNPNSYPIIIEH
jgi:carbamoyl-phosphate synthase large subunit